MLTQIYKPTLRSKRGVLAAVSLAGLLLSVSLVAMIAVDIGHNVCVRSQLQNAVDAAALAGARDWAAAKSWNSVDSDALSVASDNVADGRTVSNLSPGTMVTVTSQAPNTTTPGSCTVAAQMRIQNLFAKLVNHGNDAINATSTAYMAYATASPQGALLPVAANVQSFMGSAGPLPVGSPISLRISADNNAANSHFTAFQNQTNTQLQVQVQAQWDPPSPGCTNQIQTQLQGPVFNPGYATQVQTQTQGQPLPGYTCQYQVQIQAHYNDSGCVQNVAQYQFQSQCSGTPSPPTSVGQTVAFTSDGDPGLCKYFQQNCSSGQTVTFPVFTSSNSAGQAMIVGYATMQLTGATTQQWYGGQMTDLQIQGTLCKPIVWQGITTGSLPTSGMTSCQQATVCQNNPMKLGLGG